jgi:hypothetical protein
MWQSCDWEATADSPWRPLLVTIDSIRVSRVESSRVESSRVESSQVSRAVDTPHSFAHSVEEIQLRFLQLHVGACILLLVVVMSILYKSTSSPFHLDLVATFNKLSSQKAHSLFIGPISNS